MQILRTLLLSGTIFSSCISADDVADRIQREQSISNVKDSIQSKLDRLKCQADILDEPKPYLELAVQLNAIVISYLDSIDRSETKDILTYLNVKYHNIFDSTIRHQTYKLFPIMDIDMIDSTKFQLADDQNEMNSNTKLETTLSVLRTHNFVLDFFTISFSHDPCTGQKASR